MHPIVADHLAADLRASRLAESATRRRLRAARPTRPTWRARQADRLLVLARRLDPTVEGRGHSRTAMVR